LSFLRLSTGRNKNSRHPELAGCGVNAPNPIPAMKKTIKSFIKLPQYRVRPCFGSRFIPEEWRLWHINFKIGVKIG